MKKHLAIVWVLLFCCSAAQAAQFDPVHKNSIGPIYEYYADFGTTSESMAPGAIVPETSAYPVRVQNIPNRSEDLCLYYLSGYDDFYPYTYAFGLRESDGYPPPGPAYEGIEYVFYIDLNSNGSLDTGEPRDAFSLASDSIRDMVFVTDFNITPENHPTVTWKKIAAYNDLLYRIRIYPIKNDGFPDTSDLLFQSEFVTPVDGTFTCAYTGDLFNQYYVLALCVEAVQVVDGRIPYRSRYFMNHSKYIQSSVPGDINEDNKLDLKDIVTGMRVISNIR